MEQKYSEGIWTRVNKFGKFIQDTCLFAMLGIWLLFIFAIPCVYEFGSVFYQQYMVLYSSETKVSTLHKIPWYGKSHPFGIDVYAFAMSKGEDIEHLNKKILVTDTKENKRIFLPVSCTLEYPKFIQQTTRITKETKQNESVWTTRINEKIFMERLGEVLQQADVSVDQLPNEAEKLIQKWFDDQGITSVVCKIENTVNPQRNVEIED